MGIGIQQGTVIAGMRVTGAARRTKVTGGSDHVMKADNFMPATGTAIADGSITTIVGIATGTAISATIGTN
jgi:hypothetical protein